jgi:hypothetical protein
MNYKRTNNFIGDRYERHDRMERPNRQNQYQGPKISSIDDIVNYIEKNKKFINNPHTEKLDMNEIHAEHRIEALQYNKTSNVDSLPANLQSIFGSTEFIRAGSLTHVAVPENIDVSYISSLIMLMVPDFTQMKDDDKVDFVQAFIRKLCKESRENFAKFGYDKLGWNVKEFVNNVKIFKIGKDMLRYVADFLNINIFILDCEMDSLIYVGEKTFSKYKKNVLLMKIRENRFEPVFMRDALFIDHKSFIIKKLMNSRFLVERLDCDFTNEKEEFNFVIGQEDLEKYFEYIADKTKKIDDVKNPKSSDESKTKDESKIKDETNTKTKNMVLSRKQSQESDDLNGFDQEDEDYIMDESPNSNMGHLSDDQDDNSYDSDSNKFESDGHSSDHKGKKNTKNSKSKKLVALSDKSDMDSITSSPKKGKKITKQNKKNIRVNVVTPRVNEVTPRVNEVTPRVNEVTPRVNEVTPRVNVVTPRVDAAKTVAQLKEIAKQLGIDLTYDKNGKKSPKTKPMLIADINNN